MRCQDEKSAYIANILNGVLTNVVVLVYSIAQNRHFPRTMDELMVIPADFGASEENRLDLSVKEMSEVVTISRQVQDFCLGRGIDERRSYLAGLTLEEMAGNIVDHGYTKVEPPTACRGGGFLLHRYSLPAKTYLCQTGTIGSTGVDFGQFLP